VKWVGWVWERVGGDDDKGRNGKRVGRKGGWGVVELALAFLLGNVGAWRLNLHRREKNSKCLRNKWGYLLNLGEALVQALLSRWRSRRGWGGRRLGCTS